MYIPFIRYMTTVVSLFGLQLSIMTVIFYAEDTNMKNKLYLL